MELDDFRKNTTKQTVGIPANGVRQEARIDSVIELFREEEKKKLRQSFIWAGILVSLSLFYFTRIIGFISLYSLGMMILGAGFVMGAVYVWKFSKPIPESTYSLPLVRFLDVAEKRTRYIRADDLLRIIPILLVLGLGGGMVLTGSLMKYTGNTLLVIVIWIVFYTCLCLFGFRAGRKNWEKKYGELYSMIVGTRDSLKENGHKQLHQQ